MTIKLPASAGLAVASLILSGCGAAAVPCRVASAGLKAIPILGHPLAGPTDACADAIDPAGRDVDDDPPVRAEPDTAPAGPPPPAR